MKCIKNLNITIYSTLECNSYDADFKTQCKANILQIVPLKVQLPSLSIIQVGPRQFNTKSKQYAFRFQQGACIECVPQLTVLKPVQLEPFFSCGTLWIGKFWGTFQPKQAILRYNVFKQ